VFGLSFWEIVVIVILAIVVAGPRQLPEMMRTAGRAIARLRRLLFDMRTQSGIDEILRQEGLAEDIQEFRNLVRGNVMERLTGIEADLAKLDKRPEPATPPTGTVASGDLAEEQEYPVEGCDSYGAVSEDDPYAQVLEEEQATGDWRPATGDDGEPKAADGGAASSAPPEPVEVASSKRKEEP